MKFFRLILTIYFTALLVMPCNNVKAQSNLDKSFSLSMDAENSHSEDKEDNCSPLCICNCCRMIVIYFKTEPFINFPKDIKSNFSKKIDFKKNDFAYLVYDQIWQPPKI
ncbi:hypothetical protein EJ377_07695 [Chryseobacterium arthrosphaerae]|uniref:Uncharacterized protein n=1 Tax=Chryseobacterium arthrosphaerae TaxID=651561 RepID=A0A432E046_9FLAO|nr:hypothetical protein EJ377_07695 [Chryseobacterium arthrosphaerae]